MRSGKKGPRAFEGERVAAAVCFFASRTCNFLQLRPKTNHPSSSSNFPLKIYCQRFVKMLSHL